MSTNPETIPADSSGLQEKLVKEEAIEPVNNGEKDMEKDKDTDKIKNIKNLKIDSKVGSKSSLSSSPELTSTAVSATKLDKSILSNLNKTLKVKQKIINSKDLQPKTISEIINRSPQATNFPMNSQSTSTVATAQNLSTELLNESIPNLQLNDQNLNNSNLTDTGSTNNTINSTPGKKTRKPKANSTRTDIFAAKLASAVDDVDSSDSDETFVYENNLNDDYTNEINENDNNSSSRDSSEKKEDNTEDEDVRANTSDGEKEENTNEFNDDKKHATSGDTNRDNINLDSASAVTTDNDQASTFESPPSTLSRLEHLNDLSNIKDANNDSINSLNSNKQNKDKVRPSTLQNSHLGAINATSGETIVNKSLRPATNRTYSSHSIPDATKRSISPYNNSSNASSSNHGFNAQQFKQSSDVSDFDKFSNYNDIDDDFDVSDESADEDNGHTIHAEEDSEDEVNVDDVSSKESYSSSKHMVSSSNTTVPKKGGSGEKDSMKEQPRDGKQYVNVKKYSSLEPTNSITSKSTGKKKTSSTSSKLRSTTSKLFNKKGSQPRRYSIIPDDIDIEDFDDELIYYDNNIRFPYNNTNTSVNNSSLNYNENSSLLNGHHRIPRYRSLNLNPQALKKANKTKRYLSTGQPLLTTPSSPAQDQQLLEPQNQNNDIFPFPYPEQPTNQNAYYFGFDEYDEETGSINEHQFDKIPRKPSARFGSNSFHNHHLSSSNNHFLLPRKNSFSNTNYNYAKRVIYMIVSIVTILTIGFVMGFIIALTKDLSDVSIVEIKNPVVSQDELVFNVVVEALNPGWFTIGIKQVELDIFAKSGYIPPTENDGDLFDVTSVETVLLGSVFDLESEITFDGVFFNRLLSRQVGEIKLVLPGKNLTSIETSNNSTAPDNSAKWEVISKNPFDLITRGILKYKLPLSKTFKSVVVSKTTYVDPNIEE